MAQGTGDGMGQASKHRKQTMAERQSNVFALELVWCGVVLGYGGWVGVRGGERLLFRCTQSAVVRVSTVFTCVRACVRACGSVGYAD